MFPFTRALLQLHKYIDVLFVPPVELLRVQLFPFIFNIPSFVMAAMQGPRVEVRTLFEILTGHDPEAVATPMHAGASVPKFVVDTQQSLMLFPLTTVPPACTI